MRTCTTWNADDASVCDASESKETVKSFLSTQGYITASPGGGTGRATVIMDADTNYRQILFAFDTVNPIPDTGYVDLSLSGMSCSSMTATVYCVTDLFCYDSDTGVTTSVETVSGVSYFRISNLFKGFIAGGNRIEFSIVHSNCDDLIPDVDSTLDLDAYTGYIVDDTYAYIIDAFETMTIRRPNRIIIPDPPNLENGADTTLTITLNLMEDISASEWIIITIPVPNRDLLPTSQTDGTGDTTDVFNIPDDAEPTITYTSGDDATVNTVTFSTITYDSEPGNASNDWL